MEGTLFIIHVTEESRTVTSETRFISRDWNESIQKKAVKKSRIRDKLVVSLQGQTRRITRVCDKTTQVDPYEWGLQLAEIDGQDTSDPDAEP